MQANCRDMISKKLFGELLRLLIIHAVLLIFLTIAWITTLAMLLRIRRKYRDLQLNIQRRVDYRRQRPLTNGPIIVVNDSYESHEYEHIPHELHEYENISPEYDNIV
jgi:uncharacterized metal-binding protein